MALKMALSCKLKDNQLLVLDGFNLEKIRTQDFLEALSNLNVRNALIITPDRDEKLELSSRNVPDVKILRTEGLNVYDILKYENLVLLESSIKGIEGRLLS
jgi:large subunit ribosomal protein L4